MTYMTAMNLFGETSNTNMVEEHDRKRLNEADHDPPEEKDSEVGSFHRNFAGRLPAGKSQPVTISKNGNRHIRLLPSGEKQEVLSVGLACSECFSGPRLGKLLQPGFDYERKVMDQLMSGDFASPLSTHTSAGVPVELDAFVKALEPHLPWAKNEIDNNDWCLSLQLEGASAVWAAIDMLLQEIFLATGDKYRNTVAVGATSYHGPPSTSFGSKAPLWTKDHQVTYPVPTPQFCNEDLLLEQFEAFLEENASHIGVLVVEPQWGSSQAAFPWPKNLLRRYIRMAQAWGIRVLCDEIMCGLGRHGLGALFVSTAWELNPDAVTFGKAIGAGVSPLAGAVIKRGKSILSAHNCSVMQSHTYAGASNRALMTATAVLLEIPHWFETISSLGEEMRHIFRYLSKISDGMIVGHGQGLMWGCLWSHDGQNQDNQYRSASFACFQKHCTDLGVVPYFVPNGGFMVTPLYDIDTHTLYEVAEKLEQALVSTMRECSWQITCKSQADSLLAAMVIPSISGTVELPRSRQIARSCVSCSNNFCQIIRTRYMQMA